MVPSPLPLFTCEVNCQMSANSIAKADLEVDINLFHSHDVIFIISSLKLHVIDKLYNPVTHKVTKTLIERLAVNLWQRLG